MSQTTRANGAKDWTFGGLMFALGAFVGLVIALACIAGFFILRNFVAVGGQSPAENEGSPLQASVEIWVAEDGCHVHRGEVQSLAPVRSLTWVFQTMDGEVVLERNAQGEFRTRYFRQGQYRVHLKAFIEGSYHQISDEVKIQCPPSP